jgi:exopolyphosphatase/guanosine-5'-triphosphate,3'-diphosphate pyrophosphatase
MRPLAVIDVGSNSICLLVALPLRDGRLYEVAKRKESAKLRDHIDADSRLSTDGIAKLLAAMREFRSLIDAFDAEVRAVATASLRAAVNAIEVVALVRAETGIALEVISGDTEARLAFRGVTEGLGLLAGEVICIDVGGGSTELVLGRDGQILHTASVPVGALVASRRWLGSDPVAPAAVAQARTGLLEVFAPVLEPFRRAGIQGIAASGTAQRLGRMLLARTGELRPDVDRLPIARADLAVLLDALAAAPTLAERARLPGMDPSRADSLHGGALIHDVIAGELGLPAWTVSMSGLRVGVLAQLRDASGAAQPGAVARP